MSFELRISRRAIQDIQGILERTSEYFGARKQAEYAALIRQALKNIASAPDAPPAKHRPEFHSRALTYHIARRGQRARHFFLYRVRDHKIVEIGRLLHDSMDLEQHLPEGFEAGE